MDPFETVPRTSEVASQPPQATSDRMIPRDRRLATVRGTGTKKPRQASCRVQPAVSPRGRSVPWFLESSVSVRITRKAELIVCDDCTTL